MTTYFIFGSLALAVGGILLTLGIDFVLDKPFRSALLGSLPVPLYFAALWEDVMLMKCLVFVVAFFIGLAPSLLVAMLCHLRARRSPPSPLL